MRCTYDVRSISYPTSSFAYRYRSVLRVGRVDGASQPEPHTYTRGYTATLPSHSDTKRFHKAHPSGGLTQGSICLCTIGICGASLLAAASDLLGYGGYLGAVQDSHPATRLHTDNGRERCRQGHSVAMLDSNYL